MTNSIVLVDEFDREDWIVSVGRHSFLNTGIVSIGNSSRPTDRYTPCISSLPNGLRHDSERNFAGERRKLRVGNHGRFVNNPTPQSACCRIFIYSS